MSVMKYKDPTTGEVKKVGAPKVDTYTKAEADELLQNKADASSVYTRSETDTLLQKKVNPNLLDNWYFGNPIDQRGGYVVPSGTTYYYYDSSQTVAGTTSAYYTVKSVDTNGNATFEIDGTNYWCIGKGVRGYIGTGYGIDRFVSESQYLSVLIVDGCITLKNGNSGGWWKQRFPVSYAGEIATASILLADGTMHSLTSILSNTVSFLRISGNAYLGICSTYFGIYFNTDEGNSVPIKATKLELGSQQTLAHQDENGKWQLNEIPDYGEQLRRCQRYQRKIFISMLTATYVWNQTIRFSLNDVLNGMRATPALTLFGKQMDTAVSSTDGLMAVIPGGNGDSGWDISAGTTYSLLVENNSIIIKAIIPKSKFTVTSNSGLNYALHCGEGVYIFADANL